MYKTASRHQQYAAVFGGKKKKSIFNGPGKRRKKRKAKCKSSLSPTAHDKMIISMVTGIGCIECKSNGFYKEKRCLICPNYALK